MSLSRSAAVRVVLALALGVVALPAAAAPGAFTLTGRGLCYSGSGTVLLQWTGSSGATSYTVIRDDGFQVVGTGGRYFDFNVVAGGPPRTYFIRASDGGPATTDSNSITAAPPASACAPPPAPLTITGFAYCYPGDPQRSVRPAAHVEWRPVQNATFYDMYRNGVLIFTSFAGATSYSLADLVSGPGTQTITYYVVARNSAGTAMSNTVQVVVPPDICVTAPPSPVLTGNAACNPSTHQPMVALDWTVVTDAEGWQLFRDGNPYAVPQAPDYSDTNVQAGHTYTYNVATNGLNAPLSNTITVTVPTTICVPGPFSVTPITYCNGSAPGVHLGWTASENAVSYSVMRDATTLASGLTFPVYQDTTVTSGGSYSYRVVATNSSGSTSTPSAAITVGREACPPGSFVSAVLAVCRNGAPAADVTWSQSANATTYVVIRDYEPVSTTLPATATEYVDVPPAGVHFYWVSSANAAGSMTSSNAIFVPTGLVCTLPAPGAFAAVGSAVCSGSKVATHVAWTPSSGATSYVVNRDGAPVTGTLTSSTTSFDDAGVTAGKSYRYVVIASNSGGNTTAPAVDVSPSGDVCPPSSFSLSATTSCNQPVTLNWTAPANATGYTIMRNGAAITSVGVTTTTFADSSVAVAGEYTYVVRAIGQGGVTDSNMVTVTFDPSACDIPCNFSCAANVDASAEVMAGVRFRLMQQPSCESTTVTWTFGDGAFSNSLTASHAYASAGTFHWTVAAGNGTAGSCQSGGAITITAPAVAPKRRAARH